MTASTINCENAINTLNIKYNANMSVVQQNYLQSVVLTVSFMTKQTLDLAVTSALTHSNCVKVCNTILLSNLIDCCNARQVYMISTFYQCQKCLKQMCSMLLTVQHSKQMQRMLSYRIKSLSKFYENLLSTSEQT